MQRKELILENYRASRNRRILRNVFIAGAMAAGLTAGGDIRFASAHPHHALTRTVGGHHSDRTSEAGKHYQRRGVREEPLASLSQPKERSTEIGRPFEGSGIASVYSGQHTASGEHMNSGAMTAAHRTLPFGSKVTVVNRSNGRSAVVRINDRGPFMHGRVIDLSPAAARVLGIDGLTTVSLSTKLKAHRPGWLESPRPL